MSEQNGRGPEIFVLTKGYRLFADVCDACRRFRLIGLGYGPPSSLSERSKSPSSVNPNIRASRNLHNSVGHCELRSLSPGQLLASDSCTDSSPECWDLQNFDTIPDCGWCHFKSFSQLAATLTIAKINKQIYKGKRYK